MSRHPTNGSEGSGDLKADHDDRSYERGFAPARSPLVDIIPDYATLTRLVAEIASAPAWVMDGNYSGTLEQRLRACDAVVFLDLPRVACVRGVVVRWLRYRGRTRADMAPACPEQLTWQFLRWIWDYPRRSRPKVQ